MKASQILLPMILAASFAAAATPASAQGYGYGDDEDGIVFAQRGGSRWVPCAREDGYCDLPYPTTVRFGADGRYLEARASGGIECSRRRFGGDPASGRIKTCFYLAGRPDPGYFGGRADPGYFGGRPMPRREPEYAYRPRGERWVYCAPENGTCSVPYPTRVRYGAAGRFAETRTGGAIPCINDVFGDPIDGVEKACFFLER